MKSKETITCEERADEILAQLRHGWTSGTKAHNRRVLVAALERLAWDAGLIGWRTAQWKREQLEREGRTG